MGFSCQTKFKVTVTRNALSDFYNSNIHFEVRVSTFWWSKVKDHGGVASSHQVSTRANCVTFTATFSHFEKMVDSPFWLWQWWSPVSFDKVWLHSFFILLYTFDVKPLPKDRKPLYSPSSFCWNDSTMTAAGVRANLLMSGGLHFTG